MNWKVQSYLSQQLMLGEGKLDVTSEGTVAIPMTAIVAGIVMVVAVVAAVIVACIHML